DLEAAPQPDGPLSEDPQVARAQRQRAEYGLPSDAATVQRLLASDPHQLRWELGFPATRQEVEAVMSRNAAADHAELIRGYARNNAAQTFGGLWIDQAAGGVLRVAFTADAARHEAALREHFGPAVDISAVTVANSLAQLEAVRERIDFDRPLGRAILLGHAIREDLNRVALDVVAVDAEARAILAERFGADLICVVPHEGPPRGTLPGGGAPGVVEIPTTEVANMQLALMPDVTLAGDPQLDGGCVWVEHAGRRTAVVWPPGFGARFTPDGVELVDAQGRVVAREGDPISLGGGNHPEPLARCQVGGPGAFVAGSVTRD
ncbi:MAG: hypothetical protein M3N52_09450, partial [Actinomycetota bacterium]|nr:hypothetical protein [Actinomycetota bacterium]